MKNLSNYEKEYLKTDFEDYLVAQRRKKVLSSITDRKKILEIGCGFDPLFNYIDWSFEEYTIIEPSVKFIENAKIIALNKGVSVNFINSYFETANDLKKKSYDAIICSSLLHEVQFPEEILKKIYALSNQETLIHVNVPNANSFHRLLAKEMKLINSIKDFSDRNIRFQQYRVFDMNDLISMCKKTGFKIVEQGSYFIKPFSHDQMSQMLNKNIIDLSLVDALYSMSKYCPGIGAEIYVNIKK